MRIDSMDAASFTAGKSVDISGTTKVTKAVEEIKPVVKDFKNISQMTGLERKELPISEKVVIDAIERANRAIMGANRKFEFSIHEKTKEIMVKVIDSDTNEVIREIPPEKILDLVAKMWEMAGLIVDERR